MNNPLPSEPDKFKYTLHDSQLSFTNTDKIIKASKHLTQDTSLYGLNMKLSELYTKWIQWRQKANHWKGMLNKGTGDPEYAQKQALYYVFALAGIRKDIKHLEIILSITKEPDEWNIMPSIEPIAWEDEADNHITQEEATEILELLKDD